MRIAEWVIMVMRLTWMCWATCLIHHFSVLAPVSNHQNVLFWVFVDL